MKKICILGGENNSGYCHRLDWAGKYTEKEILEKSTYYNNYKDTIAIECGEVDNISVSVVTFDSIGMEKN